MKEIHAYLTFNGDARKAMTFYAKCLGAKLELVTFGEAEMPCPPSARKRVMHARIGKGAGTLMASDNMPGMKFKKGNNFSVSIGCTSVPEIEKLFVAFSRGGKVTMPLEQTSWARRFGMLTDRFGIQWMFNLDN